MMRCPTCAGTGEIAELSPVYLPPRQFRIWDTVRRAKHGISIADLADRVYSDRPDGGPGSATQSIWGLVRVANKRLAPFGQRIEATRGPGSVYSLQYFDPT